MTVAGIPVPRQEATAFGVIQTAADGRGIEAFLEKPADPPGLPGRPDETFASMGNYVFTTEALLDALHTDAADEDSKHDMGGNIVPMLVRAGRRAGLRLPVERGARRDRGRRALLARRRDARRVLRRPDGPVRVGAGLQPLQRALADPHPHPARPPAKFVHDDGGRVGPAVDSIVSNGVIVSGGAWQVGALPRRARVTAGPGGAVGDHGRLRVGRGAVVRNAILDKNVVVPEGVQVGVDKDDDRERGLAVSEAGITVSARASEVPAG